MFYTYFVVFLTDAAKIEPWLAGVISFTAIAWDGITDPLVGHLSDKPKASKKKLILYSILPMSILFVIAFKTFDIPLYAKVIYYTLTAMLFWLAYTVYTIPYYAICAEMTGDYDERTKIRSISAFINVVGIFIGAAAPVVLVEMFVGKGAELGASWTLSAGAVAVISIIFGFITYLSIRKIKIIKQEGLGDGFFKTFLALLKLKPFKYLLAFIAIFMIQSSLGQANLIYLLKDRMGVDPDVYMVYALAAIVGGMVVFVPFVMWLSTKRDRRFAVILSCSIAAVVMYAFAFIGITNVVSLIIVMLAYSLSIAAFWSTLYSFSYDICEIDEFVNGVRREGAITSLPQFLQKLGAATGLLVLGLVLSLFKYNEALAVQSQHTLIGIESIITIICPTIMIISVLFMYLYPITKKRFNKLDEQLNNKKNGKPIDTEGLERLI